MQKIFKPGDKVNGYTVIDYNDETEEYEFVCDECGTKKTGYYYHLMKVCTHSMSTTLVYSTYNGMLRRCYNPSTRHYYNYGGRGIKVCDEWLKNPKSFEDWCMENGWKPKYQLDRINNDLGYCPENCRWVSVQDNQNNKRSNVKLTVGNDTLTLSEWSRKLNIPTRTLSYYYHSYGEIKTRQRIINKWDNYKPKTCKYLTVGDETLSYSAWSKRLRKVNRYVSDLVAEFGKEEAIHRIAIQWKAVQKGEFVYTCSHGKYLTIDGVTDAQRGWARRVNRSPAYIRNIIRRYGEEKAVQIIRERWKSIQSGVMVEKTIKKKLYTIQGVTDSMAGWSRRVHRGESYFTGLVYRHGEEEAIRRITEQWEAIKKNEQ